MSAKADLLIITVTELESRVVLQTFQRAARGRATPHSINDRMYFDLGTTNGARIFLTQSEMGTGGLDASLETVRKGIEALKPAAVVMVGIAFGINDQKQAIGDILVTEQLCLYDLQRIGTQGSQTQIILRGDKPHASPWLINHLKGANLLWESAKVRFGVVLTGDKLVDNVDFRDQLRGFEPEAIGGEMEGAGLYVACQDKKVDWILIKAICDWADGQKATDKDARQQTAAQNAAAFLLYALQFTSIDWEKKRQEAAHVAPTLINAGTGSLAATGGVASGAGGAAIGGDIHGDVIIHPQPVLKNPEFVHSSLPPQPYFFGREKELRLIADAIAPEARTWGALIDGPGGIGKTALAIRAGHLASTDQFKTKIFLSAKGTQLTPQGEQALDDFSLPNYAALLTELAQELGDESIIKIDPSRRAIHVRRLLSDRRALVIFDNIEALDSSERIRLFQFLSHLPLTCKALVTNRYHADVAAETIRLDQLTIDAAHALIDKLAERYPLLTRSSANDKQNLYELAGGNPLIIEWVAGQLGREHSKCRTIQDAWNYLVSAPRDNDPLEYIFRDLVASFRKPETEVLSALAQFTLPAQISWIADVTGFSTHVVESYVRDLTSRSLVVSDPAGERFLLLPLAAEYLRQRYPDIISQLREQFVTQVFTFIMDNGWENTDRFHELEMGWPKIASALPIIIANDDSRFQKAVRGLNKFLELSGRWDELLSLNLKAEERSAQANSEDAGWRAYRAGEIYFWRGRTEDVLACAKRAGNYWQNKIGREKALALHLKGLGLGLQHDFVLAVEAHKQSLAIHQSITPESIDVAVELNDLANAERLSGDFDSAEDHYNSALFIDERINNYEGVAIRTGNLALLALNRGDLTKAEALARKALSLAESLKRPDLIAHNCRRIGWALVRQGRPNEGLPFAQHAIRIYQQYPSPRRMEEAQTLLRECTG